MTMQLRKGLLLAVLCLASLCACAGTVTYYHNDLAGNPVAATNQQGAVIWRESYRPYGERLTNSAAASGNKIWFTSRRQDVETGLVYMGARYYDPVAGRFISTDPIAFDERNPHSFNRYAYANNNPYRFVDPDGRSPLVFWIARATGAGYGAGVMADAASQYFAWGSVDLRLAMSSSAARAGAEAGLMSPAPGMSIGLTTERVGGAAAERIAAGHAFEKHVMDLGEFKGLGIRTREQFAAHIDDVIQNPSATKELSRGRTAFWQESSGTVVIRDPASKDLGTAFQPQRGREYFEQLKVD